MERRDVLATAGTSVGLLSSGCISALPASDGDRTDTEATDSPDVADMPDFWLSNRTQPEVILEFAVTDESGSIKYSQEFNLGPSGTGESIIKTTIPELREFDSTHEYNFSGNGVSNSIMWGPSRSEQLRVRVYESRIEISDIAY